MTESVADCHLAHTKDAAGRSLRDVYDSQSAQASTVAMWHKVLQSAKTNPALQDLLDQAIVLYKLSEES